MSTAYRLDGEAVIDESTDLTGAEIAGGGFDALFCNIEEVGASTHVLTEGGHTPLWIGVRCGTTTAGDPPTTMPVYAGVSLKSGPCSEIE